MDEHKQGSVSEGVERVLRAYEAALVEAGVLGRHGLPEEESEHLRELRMQVIRRAEALPSMWRPRATCEHCRGQREVTAVQAQYSTGSTPEFVSGRRLCPQCWGTGLTLALPPPD